MRLHLVALPHTKVSSEFCGCAYTSKVLKFCLMLGKDYDIHLYAPEGPEVKGATLHSCITNEERTDIFGEDDPHRLPDWPTEEQTRLFNQRVIQELKPGPRDLILLSGGWTHHAIAESFPGHLKCEPFIGYYGIMGGNIWGAYESYFHMAQVYYRHNIQDIRWFDRVIPPFYDPGEFPDFNTGRGDYLLFLGRLILRKGAHIASEIAQACGLPLKVAGAGGKQVGNDIVAPEVTIKNAEYLGPVGIKDRSKLMAGARAVLFPTIYAEPGGNVAIESMACGTPVIASDFGVATETVQPWISGFRFRTLSEARQAINNLPSLDPVSIRAYALETYSLEAIRPKFQAWFENLNSLFGKGWYS